MTACAKQTQQLICPAQVWKDRLQAFSARNEKCIQFNDPGKSWDMHQCILGDIRTPVKQCLNRDGNAWVSDFMTKLEALADAGEPTDEVLRLHRAFIAKLNEVYLRKK